ncbi:toprim domain-containing protein [Fastidiosibacter lacustris]|uniref:toprim domain-containing protein n=1 Tax=Fastidiosibacter lacustris TaxID=2056695 RepID=UPI000E342CA4|nr:toprim domain-containing protein [Fastidiosibacter lacustris]
MRLEEYMLKCGYTPPSVINPDGYNRYPAPDKGKGNKAGWLIVISEECAVFGDWVSQSKYVWHANMDKMSHTERTAAYECAIHQAERLKLELQQQQEEVAHQCQFILNNSEKAQDSHAYLVKKSVISFGLHWAPHLQGVDNALIVPIYGFDDGANTLLQSLQIISPQGDKRFFKGGRKKAGFYPLQVREGKDVRILIAEGYATAASLAMVQPNDSVYCAFDAGNLKDVALSLRKYHPFSKIVICADNDRFNDKNTGVLAARDAANSADAVCIVPRFETEETGTDWNDWLVLRGYIGTKEVQS